MVWPDIGSRVCTSSCCSKSFNYIVTSSMYLGVCATNELSAKRKSTEVRGNRLQSTKLERLPKLQEMYNPNKYNYFYFSSKSYCGDSIDFDHFNLIIVRFVKNRFLLLFLYGKISNNKTTSTNLFNNTFSKTFTLIDWLSNYKS